MNKKLGNCLMAAIMKGTALFALLLLISLTSANEVKAYSDLYTVKVDSGYLALRTAKAYDSRNEIGELYTGDTVEVKDYSDSTYWYVYSYKHNRSGYVNKNYLVANSDTVLWNVRVDKGYLALRNAKGYDSRNEIGELYTGDSVEVVTQESGDYWYVYSPKHGKYGYVNKNYLYSTTSSSSSSIRTSSSDSYTVWVETGYLALRTAKAYDSRNEIGELYTGDTVDVISRDSGDYWYVYSPKHNKEGYVNKNYLVGANSNLTRTVKVDSGYLALRTAKGYDSRNEIGELYTGDTVQLIDCSDATYWYVYSPKYNQSGYVNKNYLSGSGYDTKTVRVDKGYLALRTAKAYDSSNEIGAMYTGETVQVISRDSGDYWYVYSPKLGRYGYTNKNYLY